MRIDSQTRPTFDASTYSFAVLASRFNESIVARLAQGAPEALERCKATRESVSEFWVPGALELPLIAQELARSGRYDAVITLGCVIRGETPHFDYVAGGAAHGVVQASLATGVPILFGVITADNREQAEARAGGSAGNKGAEAALAAIEMANLIATLRR